MAAVVPRMSATPGAVRHAGRNVGQDTRSVLADLLDLQDSDFDALVHDGIVAEKRAGA